MTEDKKAWKDLLTEIAPAEPLRWIGVETKNVTKPPFEGKIGWLRFMGDAKTDNLVAGTLPVPDQLSGEWVDGDATISAKMRGDGYELRTITEAAPQSDKAFPALRHDIETLTRAVPGCPAKWMQIAVYMGFRTDEDFAEGKLSTLAERFIGFSNTSQPAAATKEAE